MRTRWPTWTWLLCLALSITVATADKKPFEIEETAFKSLPANIFYFDDSDTILVTDLEPGIVYRSTDAGVKWKAIRDIPEGQVGEVFPHPYDNKVAIAIGIDKTHWITKDQGDSWSDFKTEYPVARGRPLSFHAGDADRIIITTLDCVGFDCVPKVTPPPLFSRPFPN